MHAPAAARGGNRLSRIRIAAVLGLWLASGGVLAAESAPLVGAAEVAERVQAQDAALAVLDVRTPAEYAEGHLPGAINVPHDEVAARLGELESLRDRDIVVYCRSGRRAGLALEVLEQAGFKRLQHLEGDMQGWIAAGRPVERSAPAPAPEPPPPALPPASPP
jgi:phage shock protein E